MAFSRIRVWIPGEILTADDLNTEHDGHITNENDLDVRLTTEVSARTTLESEHDTLTANVWDAANSQIAANRVAKASMKDDSVGADEIEALAIVDAHVATANKDGVAATACMRTLGDGAQQACAGNDDRLIKAWINFKGTGTIGIKDSYNILTIGDNGVGDYTIHWDIDFANTDYAMGHFLGAQEMGVFVSNQLTEYAQILVHTHDGGNIPTDIDNIMIMAIGDQ